MDKDRDLDAFLEAGRQAPPQPSDDFMARMMQDALAAQPVPAPVPETISEPQSERWWRQVMQALGGWPGAAGLAAACAAGVWIGVSPPALVDGWIGIDTVLDATGIDPLSGFDLTMLEG